MLPVGAVVATLSEFGDQGLIAPYVRRCEITFRGESAYHSASYQKESQ